MKEDPEMLVVTINASQCSNLKSVLKSIIQDATWHNPALADDEALTDTRKVRNKLTVYSSDVDSHRESVCSTTICKFSTNMCKTTL